MIEQATPLQERALNVPPGPTVGSMLAAWFLKMARLQPQPELAAAYVKQAMPYAGNDTETTLRFAQLALNSGLREDARTVLEKAI